MLPASLDPLQFAYRSNRSTDDAIAFTLHTALSHLENKNTYWRFSTSWYGTVRFGTVNFWGVFHWALYLVPDTFLVPPQPRFQAIRSVTKTLLVTLLITDWPERIVITASLNLRHETHRPVRFKSAQPAKEWTQLLFQQMHLFASTTNYRFHCLLRKFRHSSR